jgi:uncharacterized protein YjbI with pentapeptide repeats
MANSEHVELLKQGVNVWNAWRQAQPNIRPDLQSLDLLQWDLSRYDFHQANFYQSNLRDSCLRQANLQEAVLYQTDLCMGESRTSKPKSWRLIQN